MNNILAEPDTPSLTETIVTLTTPTGLLTGFLLSPPPSTAVSHVALILPGSGPTDHDGNSAALPGKNNSLQMLATALAQANIATLRIDKRGVGASAGAAPPEADLRFETFVGDAVAWMERLRTDGRFQQYSIIGHSEGSLIGMIAAQRSHADAFVSLEGTGRTAQATLIAQLSVQLSAPLLAMVQTTLDQLAAGRLVDPLPDEIAQVPALAALFRPSVQPYLVSWFRYDPTAVFSRLVMPVLIIQGTTDLQVPVADAYRLADANSRARLAIIEGMNHVLKAAPASQEANLALYTDPGAPLADGLVTAVTTFLHASVA
ncbi:MAG: alpha/beta hydrolase [Ardenticatenaceae bacterium]|nr:alpha/beta hydrolase [Ardenticatenaceae bacterium]